MTDPDDARPRGRPVVALIAVGWVALGFMSIEDGRMWHGAAGVALGALCLLTYLWPDSALSRWMDGPILRRKQRAEELSARGRG